MWKGGGGFGVMRMVVKVLGEMVGEWSVLVRMVIVVRMRIGKMFGMVEEEVKGLMG